MACFGFAAAGGVAIAALSSASPPGAPVAPSDGTLAANTILDGILGDQWRAKVITTGTYANSTLLTVFGVAA